MPQWPLPSLPNKLLISNRSGSFYNAGTITPGINTKGSWSSYGTVASTGPAATGLLFMFRGNTAAAGVDTATIMDIGFNLGGTDYLIIPNLGVGFRLANVALHYIPMHIPPGASPIFRASGVRNPAVGFNFHCEVVGGEFASSLSVPTKYTDYGTDLANSGGTAITPSATANTKGSWVELSASTTAPIHEILATYQLSTGTQAAATLYMFDIGIGTAGNERVIASNIPFQTNTSENIVASYPWRLPYGFDIPTGSRLVARCQSDAASGEAIELNIVGITY